MLDDSITNVWILYMILLTCVLYEVEPHLVLPDVSVRTRAHDVYLHTIGSRNYRVVDKPLKYLQPNFHEQFVLPSGENTIHKQTRLAELYIGYIQNLCDKTGYTAKQLLKIPAWTNAIRTEFKANCDEVNPKIVCDPFSKYRTINGSCNNLLNPSWGMSGSPQRRYLEAVYDDGINRPRQTARSGRLLPSSREISNIVHRTDNTPRFHPYMSAMVMQWGQFLDHDIVGTPVLKKDNGSSYECCGDDKTFSGCIPISIRPDDPHFNRTCMNLVRSSPVIGPDCFTRVRQQMNKVTSYIDASAVYGSTTEEEDYLRRKKKGLLREGLDRLLPPSGKDNCVKKTPQDICQTAGDDRPNVVPSIGAIHTLFMREHNRIAVQLGSLNRQWNDEKIYQETRKIMAAVLQHITYTEYLPLILGRNLMYHYGLMSTESEYVQIYNATVNAGIANVFAVAAFRFGHSQIPAVQTYVGPKYKYRRDFRIEETYHRPYFIQYNKGQGFEDVIRWLSSDPQPEADRMFEDGVRDQLFLKNTVSLDLVAINIQRGRDHGIPGYNTWRRWCGFSRVRHFAVSRDGLVHHSHDNARLLRIVYNHPDDIDLFTGAMTERHVIGSSVGPTFACILGHQFHELKYGDRFWYENDIHLTRFTQKQLRSIKNIRLSKIICENLNMKMIKRNAFLTPKHKSEHRDPTPCEHLPDLDFRAWMDIKVHNSNIPESPAYGVYISQLIRYARACSLYGDFVSRSKSLTAKLVEQGDTKDKLKVYEYTE